MEIQNIVYGIPQAGKTVNDKLKLHMAKLGYDPAPIPPGLWRHQRHPLRFSLLVDYFGIEYERQADITHILEAQNIYTRYLRTGMTSYNVY